MSIGRRLFDVMRANLNAFVDRTDGGTRMRLEDLTDEQLEAELHRRRTGQSRWTEHEATIEEQARREAEEAARPSGRYRSSRDRGPTGHGRGTAGSPPLARLYAQLECPHGADLPTVRKHYRRLMRKYHPDFHTGNAEKQRIATDLTQRLTAAYNELRRALNAR